MRFRMKKGMGSDWRTDQTKDGSRVEIKPGDVITVALPEDVIYPYKYEALDPEPPGPKATVGLRVVKRSDGYYDVVNEATGNRLNDRRLSKVDAQTVASEPIPEEEDDDESPLPDTGGEP
jgi:hypothetical protein